MTPQDLEALLPRLAEKKVLVIGDLMLDEFLWGTVSRISPEAPVPVVELTGESYYPGGAANVARNLKSFAARVSVMGRVGTDARGAQLVSLLSDSGIGTECVYRDADCGTIVKTRIIARHQQVVRVDREKKTPPASALLEDARRQLARIVPAVDAIILADYGKGFLEPTLAEAACELARQQGKILAVDPSPANPLEWRAVTAVKPNRSEAFAAAGLPWSDPVEPPGEDRALLAAAETLLSKWEAGMLLITLGEQGMLLFRPGRPPYHTPTSAREVYDVSGAGDTAIALFTLALAAGARPEQAAELSNYASGAVVGKLGTATVSPAELLAAVRDHSIR